MTSEANVRQELNAIEKAHGSPIAQVRQYLKLSHTCEESSLKLLRLSWWHTEKGNQLYANKFFVASKRLFELSRQARTRAVLCLKRGHKLGFGYKPRKHATPLWQPGVRSSKGRS